MFIERPPGWFRRLFPGVIFRMPAAGIYPGKVFITFDDGPIPEATPWVLDVLDEFDVKATFFMVGENISRYPEIFREVLKRGHRAGNHTFHHLSGLKVAPSVYRKDAEECEKFIQGTLFRPPHGWLTPGQLKEMKKDYKVVMHDLVTRDYSKKTNSAQVVANIRKYARDGSIIVFHDSLKSIAKLHTALPESLRWLKSRGYEFGVIE